MNTEELLKTLESRGWNPKTVYDIGANKGNWVKHWSKRYHNADFVCFEANSKHKRPGWLVERHHWFNSVLSDENDKEVQFYDVRGTGDSYYKEMTPHYQNVEPVTLKTRRLDDIIQENNLPFADFIKIDTQGSELDVFNGAPKVLEHAQVIHVEMPVLEYNKGAPTFSDYISFFAANNFYPLALDEVHRSGMYIIQIDMCFVRNDVKLKYWPTRQGDIIL